MWPFIQRQVKILSHNCLHCVIFHSSLSKSETKCTNQEVLLCDSGCQSLTPNTADTVRFISDLVLLCARRGNVLYLALYNGLVMLRMTHIRKKPNKAVTHFHTFNQFSSLCEIPLKLHCAFTISLISVWTVDNQL